MIINKLYKTILERKKNLPEDSYTSSLFKKGRDGIIQKVGEEATEVIIAAKNADKEQIIAEVSDLLFHLLVMLAACGITPENIYTELEKRRKV